MSGRRGKVVGAIVGMVWLIGATASAPGAAPNGARVDIEPGRQVILFAVDGAARQVWLEADPSVEPRAATRPAPGTTTSPARGDAPPAPQRSAATRPRARFMEDGERGESGPRR